jgi:hypothetical protein
MRASILRVPHQFVRMVFAFFIVDFGYDRDFGQKTSGDISRYVEEVRL